MRLECRVPHEPAVIHYTEGGKFAPHDDDHDLNENPQILEILALLLTYSR